MSTFIIVALLVVALIAGAMGGADAFWGVFAWGILGGLGLITVLGVLIAGIKLFG